MFRWFAAAVLLSAVGISSFYRRRARQAGEVIARRRESPALIAGRLLLGVPLFLSVLLWIVQPRWMAWSAWPLPVALRWAGVLLGLAVLPVVWRVFVALGSNVSETVLTKREHALVTTGPYAYVRHPLYACGIGMFLAMGLMAANLFILFMAASALAAILAVVIPREEAHLIDRFGDAYIDYRRRTGRLLPRGTRAAARQVTDPNPHTRP